MIGAQAHDLGQCRERGLVLEVLVDVAGDLLLLPAGEAAADDGLLVDRAAAVEAQELVHQHDAQRLGVLPMRGTGPLRLRLELAGSLPQIAVEEVQLRLEHSLREAQLGIEQGSARIDIEIRDAGEIAGLLPARKSVAGRHEAQPAGEPMQRRSRQALDECLAVLALGAFAHDQHVAARGEAVFVRLTPQDLDGIRLHAVERGDMAACNARGRELDDRR